MSSDAFLLFMNALLLQLLYWSTFAVALFAELDGIASQLFLIALVVNLEGQRAFLGKEWDRVGEAGITLRSGFPSGSYHIRLTRSRRPGCIIVDVERFSGRAAADRYMEVYCVGYAGSSDIGGIIIRTQVGNDIEVPSIVLVVYFVNAFITDFMKFAEVFFKLFAAIGLV